MKAAQYHKYGGPEVIEITNNAPKPSLGEGQVLVEVRSASINPFDWKLRAGYMKDMIPLSFPVTIGGDFAGIVAQLGSGVTDYKIGQEVYGQALIVNGGSGSVAEFVVANLKNIARKPSKADFIQASSLPLVGSSAIQALEDHIKLQKNQKILIHGGSGGIGSIAIQLAKHLGAYVATTVSSDSIEFAKQLGADEVIDYKTEKFEEKLKDFDAVYDTVGGETTNKSFLVLKKSLPAGWQGGVIVSMMGQPNEELAKKYGVTAIGQGTQTNTKHLTRLAELVDAGAIKPQIDKVFPLDQAREAFAHLESGHKQGKIVINIKQS